MVYPEMILWNAICLMLRMSHELQLVTQHRTV